MGEGGEGVSTSVSVAVPVRAAGAWLLSGMAGAAGASGAFVAGASPLVSASAVSSAAEPIWSRHSRQRIAISSAPNRRCCGPHTDVSGGARAGPAPAVSSGSCGAGTPGAATATGSGQPGRDATMVLSSGDRSYSSPQSHAASAHATIAASVVATVQRAPAES